MNVDILHQDVQTLLEFFAKNCYKASDSSSESFFVSISHNCAKILLKSKSSSPGWHFYLTKRSRSLLASDQRSEGQKSNFLVDLFTHLKYKENSKSTFMRLLTEPVNQACENVMNDKVCINRKSEPRWHRQKISFPDVASFFVSLVSQVSELNWNRRVPEEFKKTDVKTQKLGQGGFK